MNASTDRKIILIIRPTRLDELITRFNTLQQAQFYIEHLDADFSDYLNEDRLYKAAVADTETILRQFGRVQRLQRHYLPNFIFGPTDLIVVLGQDGLVANTIKYLHGQAVIGVNPDPTRWDGVLLPFQIRHIAKIVPEFYGGQRRLATITMAKATLNDGQTLYAVNDLFIGAASHVSARYCLSFAGRSEQQSSSGIIISTGLGSSGWFKGIITGAMAIAETIGMPAPPKLPEPIHWDAPLLYFFVREPFPSKTTGTSLVMGQISPDSPCSIRSNMAGNGVIFSDGLEDDFLAFNSGLHATITVAEQQGFLVI